MTQQLNPEKLLTLISGNKVNKEEERYQKLSALFWNIIEEWDTMSDIDFSIPFADIAEMVDISPKFFKERLMSGEVMQEMLESLSRKTPVLLTRRLL